MRGKIIWFIIKTYFVGHGRGRMILKNPNDFDVSYGITDSKGNFEYLSFKRGNSYE
jgi:hypothetical protein